MKRVNGWWLIGALLCVVGPNETSPALLELAAGFGAGICAMLFVGSIQNAIDQRKDRQ